LETYLQAVRSNQQQTYFETCAKNNVVFEIHRERMKISNYGLVFA
jgi:hypothetical protein